MRSTSPASSADALPFGLDANVTLPTVVILGKVPPPYMGPAIATGIILRSELNKYFALHHIDTRAHESLELMGEWNASKIRRNVLAYAKAARSFWKHRPELVLIPFSQSTTGFAKDSVFILLAALFRRRVLVQLRGGNLQVWLKESNAIVRWYVTTVLQTARGAIVLGESLRGMFDGVFPMERVFVVPNGANYKFPPRTVRPAGIVRFLYVANLRRSKGIVDLVEAVSLLARRGIQGFTLDVVGDWRDAECRSACLELAERESLPIRFHGPKYDQDKLGFYSSADVLVFASREPEGHPWVVVEALAAGLPVIATDRGAIRESVQSNENGFLLPEGGPPVIANAMEEMIRRPELIDRMGRASKRHYETNFTEASMVARLRSTFDAIIERS